MTVSPAVRERRAWWLSELRSDHLNQGVGSLLHTVQTGDPNSPDRKCYLCCIGVALNTPDIEYNAINRFYENVNFIGSVEDEIVDAHAYNAFQEMYGVTEKTTRYLMGINDGNSISNMGSFFFISPNSLSEYWIRERAERRSFKFIARFMEIVWALEDMEVGND